MDPQAAWDQLLDAYTTGDWAAVEELADGLLEWLLHGGFPPRTVSKERLGNEWHRHLTLSACRFALSAVRKNRIEEDAQ